jgi:hypothetical protein
MERDQGPRMALISCRLESVESSRHCDRPLSQRSTNEFIPRSRTVGASTAAKYSTNSLGEYRHRSGDVFLGFDARARH